MAFERNEKEARSEGKGDVIRYQRVLVHLPNALEEGTVDGNGTDSVVQIIRRILHKERLRY